MQTQRPQERKSTSSQRPHSNAPKAPTWWSRFVDTVLTRMTSRAVFKPIDAVIHEYNPGAHGQTVQSPYMLQLPLFSAGRLRIQLQRIVGQPAQQFHNHPHTALVIVLSGGYLEKRLAPGLEEMAEREVRWFNLVKPDTFHHRVSVTPGTWVLVFSGKSSGKRGFLGSLDGGQAEYIVPGEPIKTAINPVLGRNEIVVD